MSAEMERRIGPPPRDVRYPVWAWFQHRSAAARRPDLRSTNHLPPGSAGVRLEFEVSKHEVLLSDFALWHFVLNSWYLPRSANGHERSSEAAKQRSWARIFDLRFSAREVAEPLPQKSIQATLWEVKLSSIRGVQEFIARRAAA